MSIARSQVARQGQWGLGGMRGVGGPLGLLAAAVLAGLGARTEPARAEAPKDRPNIIFILADDYGITGTSCYGGKYKTPNLDALAQSGTRFENCFSAPLCAPSRALCMTGRYAFRTGVLDNGSGARARPDSEVSIAKVLKEAGYATAVAGKWRQLSHFTTPQEGRAWGFDEFMIWGVGGQGERYWDPVYNHNGQTLADVKGKYGPDLLHQLAVDFIRRHRDGPFFLYYPMVLVHGPILPTPDSPPQSPDLFADNVAYMDKLVGKLIGELDALGLREKTLVVFTGDNGCVRGGTLNGRAIDGGKGSMKEGGSRVPLICNWKGTTPAGRVLNDLVDFSDFFTTFAELGGAKLPAGVTLDGRSFAPQLRGLPGKSRDWVYVQLGDARYVRDARWKLTGEGQLSDISDAPFREMPVSPDASPEAQSAQKKLQAVLDDFRAQDQWAGKATAKKEKKAKKAGQAKKAKKKAAKP